MIIDNNIICFLSTIGHNNFFYPNSKKVIVKKGADIEQLAYVGSKLAAIKVKSIYIVPLTIFSNHDINIIEKNKTLVLWTDKNNIAP